MKWNQPKKGLRCGQIRKRPKFALFPTTMADGTRVWLEHYVVTERVSRYKQYVDDGDIWYFLTDDGPEMAGYVLKWTWNMNAVA